MNRKGTIQNAVIVEAFRTPLGSFHGALKNIPAPELAGIVIEDLLRKSEIPASEVDEVILGNVLSAGLGQNPARQAAVSAGIPFSSSALTINMVCGSGLRAVCLAAQAVELGERKVIVAGGTENMSRTPQLLIQDDKTKKSVSSLRYDGLRCAFKNEPMGMAAEWLARKYGIGREEQDQYALLSHQKACASIEKGLFETEIVPARRSTKRGVETNCDRDECPRGDCSMEKLAKLKPAFLKDGTVTAGNATPVADGAAAVLVTSESYAVEKGLSPLARIVSFCTVGVDPQETFVAPAPAVRKLLAKSGHSIDDIDMFEVGDSFAVEALVFLEELGLDPERINARGGALALGHPLGTSGCRILVTLLHSLESERKKLGVTAICLGGGNAVAMLVENCRSGQA